MHLLPTATLSTGPFGGHVNARQVRLLRIVAKCRSRYLAAQSYFDWAESAAQTDHAIRLLNHHEARYRRMLQAAARPWLAV